ncbi:hypothetical protein ColTof3_01715 [Colletotrichum tofieldiae]|nr:hypothetical protein ColTof3_01715 [Colletotrichum tofieldiae]
MADIQQRDTVAATTALREETESSSTSDLERAIDPDVVEAYNVSETPENSGNESPPPETTVRNSPNFEEKRNDQKEGKDNPSPMDRKGKAYGITGIPATQIRDGREEPEWQDEEEEGGETELD